MRTDTVQKAIILNSEGQLLALKRSSTDTRRPLQWDLPGGLLDEGEPLESGVKREINEETGLQVNDVKVIYSFTEYKQWQDGKANIVRIFYLTQSTEESITLSYEHSEYKWMRPTEALEALEYEKQKKVISYLIEHKIIQP